MIDAQFIFLPKNRMAPRCLWLDLTTWPSAGIYKPIKLSRYNISEPQKHTKV